MGYSMIPIIVFTVFWGVIGIVCPIFAPKGPNRGCNVLAVLALRIYGTNEPTHRAEAQQGDPRLDGREMVPCSFRRYDSGLVVKNMALQPKRIGFDPRHKLNHFTLDLGDGYAACRGVCHRPMKTAVGRPRPSRGQRGALAIRERVSHLALIFCTSEHIGPPAQVGTPLFLNPSAHSRRSTEGVPQSEVKTLVNQSVNSLVVRIEPCSRGRSRPAQSLNHEPE
ncbi:V-type proton ATPase subunit e 2 [Eumeta japonica]|uniref:V-type proton ATPase subunit e 2 n=1 Tax=Eumeta variegata TaxID=151549 RepID=A0A4C1W5I2_EUMVA|nr:V-type proton ATPase subunit e 2 [Eumeta japonica]